MSRSSKGSKGLGYEYWGRRAFNGVSPSSENKRITHSIERAQAKQEIVKEMVDIAPAQVDGGLWLRSLSEGYWQPNGETCAICTGDPFETNSTRLVFLIRNLMFHGY